MNDEVVEREEATLKKHSVPSAKMDAAHLYALLAAGYEPLGTVIGVAAMSMGARGFGRSIRGLFNKGEMSMVSVTSTEARRLAIERCEDEAKDLGADLLIIDHLEVRDAAEIVEVSCMGTALKKVRDLVPMPMATATS